VLFLGPENTSLFRSNSYQTLAYAWENSAQVHSTAISQSQPPGPWKSSVPVNTHQFTFHSFALSSTPNFNGAAQRPSPIQTGPTEMLSTSISGSQSFSTPVFRGLMLVFCVFVFVFV
jgi:hypothetical protein